MKTLVSVPLFLMVLCSPAMAEGFAIKDLTRLPESARKLPGGMESARVESGRMTILCTTCSTMVAVDVLTGRSTDGTEARFRAGETTPKMMEDQCRSRDPSCTLEKLEVGPGIGWLTIWNGGSTAVLFRDGDMLTIRGIAATPQEARGHVRAALQAIAPVIIGR